MPLPKTKEEYYQQVEEKLNWLEGLIQHASGLDERIDISNRLLIEVVRLLEIMAGVSPGESPTIKAWPDNTEFALITSLEIVAAGTAYQLPSVIVPSGFAAVLKAWPDNTGTLYLAFDEEQCLLKPRSWPLLPGEYVSWQIQNTEVLYVSGTSANDRLVITVEKEVI